MEFESKLIIRKDLQSKNVKFKIDFKLLLDNRIDSLSNELNEKLSKLESNQRQDG